MSRNLYVIQGKQLNKSPSVVEKLAQEGQFIQSYREIIPIHYAKDAVSNFNSALSNYLPWLRDNSLYIWDVRNKDYDRFIKHLTSNVKAGTAVHYNSILSSFYDWLNSRRGEEIYEQYGVKPCNPIDKWNTPQRKAEDALIMTL